MNENSADFIRKHWRLIIHESASDFEPVIQKTVLRSVLVIVKELRKEDWKTASEISDATDLGIHTILEITSILEGFLFEKFKCPEPGRGREVAIRLVEQDDVPSN